MEGMQNDYSTDNRSSSSSNLEKTHYLHCTQNLFIVDLNWKTSISFNAIVVFAFHLQSISEDR